MSNKVHIWDFLEEDFGANNINDINECSNNAQNDNKRTKQACRNEKNQEVIWVKSLINPEMESEFVKFDVESLIYFSKEHIIVNIKIDKNIFPEFDSIIGFFNCWWWKSILTKTEFLTTQELSTSFIFLKRIISNEELIENDNEFYLLINSPKIIADESDPKRGLLTSKRFLII